MSRIILKLSGEALAGPKSMGFDENTVRGVAKQVRQLIDAAVEIDRLQMKILRYFERETGSVSGIGRYGSIQSEVVAAC